MREPITGTRQVNAAMSAATQVPAIFPGTAFPVTAGYGGCSRCACPGFSGGSYECDRGGCGHHYDDHN